MPDPDHPTEPPRLERLQKVLAASGVASRRVSEDLISEGRVVVDGVVATLGDKVDRTRAQIEVDGVAVTVDPTRVTYLLNKPVDVISTASDTHGRPTVVDLIGSDVRLFPVGRLDADSEGLILVTNDGALTNRLTHPRYGVDKEYLVDVEGSPAPGTLRALRQGIELDDGRTSPARVSQLSPGLLRFVLHEGRNRQIRRMCEAVGHPVRRLVRTRIGPITDATLGPGECRELTRDELHALERAIADATPESGGSGSEGATADGK